MRSRVWFNHLFSVELGVSRHFLPHHLSSFIDQFNELVGSMVNFYHEGGMALCVIVGVCGTVAYPGFNLRPPPRVE